MEAEGSQSSKRHRRDKDDAGAEVKGVGGLHPWQNASSRIIRVSRISGGKDRHSKVWTVKGLRDRRVRLSVSTSIQFYDLQDRLGYDQPSKAVDWLIKAAAAAIVDLPELQGPFPVPPPFALSERAILSEGPGCEQHLSQSKSTCSSASETSKCSVLSLSRCENLVKEKDHQNLNKDSSFGELLAAGCNSNGGAAGAAMAEFSSIFDQKQLRPLPASSTSDYFRQAETFGHPHRIPQFEPSYSSLLHYGSNPHITGMMPYNANASGEHQDIPQFSFMHDHSIPVAAVVPRGDASRNVSVSSGIAGFSRGTLQSNSPHQNHLLHGANFPFFLNAAFPTATAGGTSIDNQFPGDFNSRLQLFCNEARRRSELKRERKG